MKRAIIIVDHGSRRAKANTMLEDLAALVRQYTSDAVYPAHMELAEPTVQQAFDAAAAGGADFIYVFPYFLAAGRHSREDIPWMVAEAAARHPDVRWHCAGPIGLNRLMAELIVRRVQHCHEMQYECADCPNAKSCWRPYGW